MPRRENTVTASLNECAERVSSRYSGASWRRWGLLQASDIKVGARGAGVDGPQAGDSRVSYWYESTKPRRWVKKQATPPSAAATAPSA